MPQRHRGVIHILTAIKPATRHVTSPWMIPAILAAIFVPLILGGICFGIRTVNTLRSVAQQVNAQRDAAVAEQNHDMAEVAPHDLNLPELEQHESDPVDKNQKRLPDHNQPVAPPKFAPSNTNSAKQALASKARAAELEAEAERRIAKSKADREARNREREARYAEREKEKLARDETKRNAEEAKAYLNKLESEADGHPFDGLIATLEIDGWGVKAMAISNDGMLYVVTPDKFLAYDCRRKRRVTKLEKLKSIDRFSTLCLSDDGSTLAVGGQHGEIELQKISGRGKLKSIGSLTEGSKAITRLAFNSDQSRLMSFDRSRNFCIWDIQNKANLKKEKLGSDLLTFSENSEQNTITLATSKKWTTFGFEKGEELKSGSYPFYLNRDSIYSPDGSRILDKSGGGVGVRKLDEKKALYHLKSNGVQWTIANVNEQECLVGGNRHIYQFNWKTKKLLKVWSLPEIAYIQKIAVSPDGSLMAATYGSTSQDIFVFDLKDN